MPQPNGIQVLPPTVASRIVAGEVVDRPASVVKELIENSLDAGARKISVEIQDGGLSLTRVSDDGCGIARADVPLTLERFATSKIHTLADLKAVRTLGFRGEALCGIAAVARLEIRTRIESEWEGTRLVAEGDQTRITPAASPVGASVTVRDLFHNLPARRQSLKSPLREGELVRKTVARYALAWPEVAFRLVTDGKETFIVRRGTPLERFRAIQQRESAAEMIDIFWEADDLRVTGHISEPTVGRNNREGQCFILNGRPIRAGLLAVMLERPYAGRLPLGRNPLAVVYLEMDPRQVDVNVHPRKTEVRFADKQAVYQAILWAVEAALSPFPREAQCPNLDWPFGEVPDASQPEHAIVGDVQVMGQLRNTYIIALGSEGLMAIDQHVAHEQVLFETLLHGDRRTILEPSARLELTPPEVARLVGHRSLLAGLGLEIEPSDKPSVLLHALPSSLSHFPPLDLVKAILNELERNWHLDEDRLFERVVARAACTAAVKVGQPLSMAVMKDLVDDLLAVWSPATCPHGRPAFVTLSVEELEHRFLRR